MKTLKTNEMKNDIENTQAGSDCRERLVRLREDLAEYAHEAWSGWMEYLFRKSTKNADGTVTIPAWAVERWERQQTASYQSLPEQEKESDREEADKMLLLLKTNSRDLPPKGSGESPGSD